jgi:hypothetical protein
LGFLFFVPRIKRHEHFFLYLTLELSTKTAI